MTVMEHEKYKDERIEDIMDLQALKKYVCPKYQYKNDWYLECVACKSKNKCKAGKQAVFIIENETNLKQQKESPMEIQKRNKRIEIEMIFRKEDPVKYMLENSENIKPQSLYQKVWSWAKSNPDLEEKYHMVEKFRFLWTNPYDKMRIPDIVKMLYPEPKVTYTDIAPNSKIVTVKSSEMVNSSDNSEDSSEDSISLEDFLQEMSDDVSGEAEVKAGKETKVVSDQRTIQDAAGSSKDPAYSSMAELKKKLQKDICDYEAKIQEIRKQIEAIDTVQALMAK